MVRTSATWNITLVYPFQSAVIANQFQPTWNQTCVSIFGKKEVVVNVRKFFLVCKILLGIYNHNLISK